MKNSFYILILVFLSSCKVTTVRQDHFSIELPNEGAGGYVWNHLPANENIKIIDSTRITLKDSTGFAKYLKQYHLMASQPGIYKLRFIKRRPFSHGRDTAEVIKKYWIRAQK